MYIVELNKKNGTNLLFIGAKGFSSKSKAKKLFNSLSLEYNQIISLKYFNFKAHTQYIIAERY